MCTLPMSHLVQVYGAYDTYLQEPIDQYVVFDNNFDFTDIYQPQDIQFNYIVKGIPSCIDTGDDSLGEPKGYLITFDDNNHACLLTNIDFNTQDYALTHFIDKLYKDKKFISYEYKAQDEHYNLIIKTTKDIVKARIEEIDCAFAKEYFCS